MKFSIKDLVTFTEEILNGKLHFLCSASKKMSYIHSFDRRKVTASYFMEIFVIKNCNKL